MNAVLTERPEAAGGGPGLPCLNRNISNEPPLTGGQLERFNRLSTSHKKTAFALSKNVARLSSKWGIERIGFLTLTFADHVTCAKEAGKRFNSLRTGVLAARYPESQGGWIAVLERMKSGRIHFHLLVVLADDVRTGFDFDLAAKGSYSSANAALRAEWAFWRETAPKYRFGRTELMPVKSNEEGLSKYVGKYIAKHIGSREQRDKGVRLVRYSRDAKSCGTNFMFLSPRSKLWRAQVAQFAKKHGCEDMAAVSAKFGKRWAYFYGEEIRAAQPPNIVVGTTAEGESVMAYDVWELDRVVRAGVVARAVGCTEAEAYMALFMPRVKPILEWSVGVAGEPLGGSDGSVRPGASYPGKECAGAKGGTSAASPRT